MVAHTIPVDSLIRECSHPDILVIIGVELPSVVLEVPDSVRVELPDDGEVVPGQGVTGISLSPFLLHIIQPSLKRKELRNTSTRNAQCATRGRSSVNQGVPKSAVTAAESDSNM